MDVLLCLVLVVSAAAINQAGSEHISSTGDVIIGGLFPVHKEGSQENRCGQFNEIPGYQYMEAMLYAIDQINTRQDLLPGIKLGTIIYDTCRSPTISADKTKEFIKLTLTQTNRSELAGIIGPFVSGNSVIVGNFLRVFQIPQISYASLSVQLSNKDLYNYFFRTVPPDSFFAEALAELCKRLGWSYVSIIYSKGTYPETGTQEVIKALEAKDICVAEKHRLPRFPTPNDYDDAMIKVNDEQKANVVIFVTIQRDSRGLLEAKQRLRSANRLSLVGSVSWSNRDDITKNLGDVADGTITFGHQDGDIKAFEKHFRSLNLSNYNASYKGWFHEFWQKQFNCSLNNTSSREPCFGNESLLREHMEIAPVRVVMNAVNAMAHALHNMHKQLCPDTTKLCDKMTPFPRTKLQEFLKKVTFPDASFNWPLKFNKNNEVEGNYTLLNFRKSHRTGRYEYVRVGTWSSKTTENGSISGHFNVSFSDINWATNNTVPQSICSTPCDVTSIQVHYGSSKCCWKCQKCADNDVIQNNTCVKCGDGFLPNTNYTECLKLPLTYINVDTTLAIVLVAFSCLGLLTVTVVAAVFFINRQHKLLRAAGLEMSAIMLFGILLMFMISLTMLTKPTMILCYFSRFIVGISFTICYAPLLVKIWRIYQIFNSTTKQVRKVRGLVGLRSLLFITLGLITIQGLFCVLIFSTDPPNVQEKFDKGELILECSLIPAVFVAYLVYNVVLMFLCTIYAFLTRNFPKNFNEAMHIGVTMYLTCVVWVVFLACFLNVNDSLSRTYWISGASILIGWITLTGLFGPNLFHLCMKVEFDEDKLVIWTTKNSPSQYSEHRQSTHDVINTKSFVAMNPMAIKTDK